MQEGVHVLCKCSSILCKGPSRTDEDTSAKWGLASAFSRSLVVLTGLQREQRCSR